MWSVTVPAGEIKCWLFSSFKLCWKRSSASVRLSLWAKGKKSGKFPPVSACTAVLRRCRTPPPPPPRYISGCFKGEGGCRLLRAPRFVPILMLFQFTHIRTLRAAVWSKAADVRTYCLIPAGAVLCLQSAVAHPDSCPLTVVCSSVCCRS